MNCLSVNCTSLDELLGGGLESGVMTQIYGEAGTGKTNVCLQATRECILEGNKVAFIDTEGVSFERLRQICPSQSYKKILSKLMLFTPHTFDEQETVIKKATAYDDVALIVIDTINMLYRLSFEQDDEGTNRSLIRQMADLQLTARKNDSYILITSQVYTAENGEIKPFAGRGIEHIVKTILRLDRIGANRRRATLIKHRSQPEDSTATFMITSDGLK